MIERPLRVLVVTAMYPSATSPASGIFVKEQVDSLRRLGLDVDVLEIEGARGKHHYLAGCARVFAATLRNRYDIVHGHYAFAGLAARCQLRAPTVLTLHGSDVNLPRQRPFARLAALLADQTIVVSAELAELARLPNAAVIPCGIDLGVFRPTDAASARQALGIDLAIPVVLFPGDPARRVKRFDRFQAAIARLDRPLKVLTLVKIPRERVPLVMSAADCMVLTSESEGSPLVVREAMACNTPVVSVDVGDVRQQLEGVTPGGIVGSAPSEIAEGIQRVLEADQRSNGRANVARFDAETIARDLHQLYQRVATRHGRRHSASSRATA